MKRVAIATFLVAVASAGERACAFEAPPRVGRNFSRRTTTRERAEAIRVQSFIELRAVERAEENDKDDFMERTRRNMLLGSAATLASSLFGIQPSAALDDSELRRIDIFERIAPSVVFIDTFTEKQDTFSPNVMEVPLGTGSGFLWDRDGHIVTNYHVVRNAKFAQVAIITKKDSKSIGDLPPTKQVSSQNSPVDVFSLPSLQSSTGTGIGVLPYSSMRPYDETSSGYRRSVYKATVVGIDPGKDIAVLKIDAPKSVLNPIPIGTSSGLRVGQTSIAIGNPCKSAIRRCGTIPYMHILYMYTHTIIPATNHLILFIEFYFSWP